MIFFYSAALIVKLKLTSRAQTLQVRIKPASLQVSDSH